MRGATWPVFDITAWLSKQVDVVSASSEADLNARGLSCVLYTLGPNPMRYAFDLRDVMRRLQGVLERGDLFYRPALAPIFRACPVFSLKQLFVPSSSSHRCRVVFDIDTSGVSNVCAPGALADLLVKWLSANTTGGDWATASVVVWGGSFPDKAQSFHVYFYEYVWAPAQHNLYKNMDFTLVNAELEPYGLQVDTSITSSGIKLFHSDKWLPKDKAWRGMPQQLLLVRDSDGAEQNLDVMLWQELFDMCLPIMDGSSNCREVNYVVPAATQAPVAKRRQVGANVPVAVVAAFPATNPMDRLVAQVPAWKDVTFRRIVSAARPTVVVPVSTHCPLKQQPSDDCPAFTHGVSGKSYALINPVGEISIRCHICDGRIDIAAPPRPVGQEAELMLHDRFSSEWGRGPPGKVIRFGTIDPYTPPTMVSHQHFIQHCTRNGEKVDKVVYPKYWLQMPDIPDFSNGFGFYPDRVVPRGFYNLYTGFDPDVERAQKEFEGLAGDDLLKLMPLWLRVVKENVCAHDVALFDYFMRWMAFSVQCPERKPLVALVLIGRPGLGKGMAVTPVRLIHGPHGMVTDDIETNFNAFMARSIYLQIEELKRSDRARNALKLLITEPRMTVESKGIDKYVQDIYQHVVITSNDFDAVWWQAQERRFVAFPCEQRIEGWGPEFQAAVSKEFADKRALGALKQYLETLDLSEWTPLNLPSSSVTFRIQFESMSYYERFVYFMLKRGAVLGEPYEPAEGTRDYSLVSALLQENARVQRHDAREVAHVGFRTWAPEFVKDALPKSIFVVGLTQLYPTLKKEARVPLWKFLHELSASCKPAHLFEVKQIRVAGGGRIEAVTSLASLEEWRKAFQRHRGNLDEGIWNENGVNI